MELVQDELDCEVDIGIRSDAGIALILLLGASSKSFLNETLCAF